MILWQDQVPEESYRGALSYLETRYGDKIAYILVQKLRHSPFRAVMAKDILRACRLKPLPSTDPNVAFHLNEVTRFPPVLIVRVCGQADIADGYHRVSAAFDQSPSTLCPVKECHTEVSK